METLDLNAVARMGLILAHLLAFAMAAVGIAFGDLAIFRKRRVDADMLATSQTFVKWALYALWATGLVVIWLDTRFDPATLATKPKLLAKLTVAIALSANGWLLHKVVFHRFTVPQDDPHRAATLPAIAGAISASSWLFAAFVGVGKAVAPALGYTGFIVLYLAVVSMAIGFSLFFIRPILAARMLRPEPVHTVIAEHARQLLGPFADDYLAENGVRAADIERNPARAVVRIGKLLEEIDPAHREAFDRLTARKLRGELAEAS
ncbi:hypothetical protein QRD40_23620 [Comamonas sp. Y6]|uniref:Uncharacterized protein n=1 Tax=Comamonas resistens TaxID=3046670 RepID=A0ABY8SZA1_9BURK|nr:MULTISPECIES: hypothetical protein [Comamonadaceae]MDL5039324.1 hypothetical protein [Comamonas resistens]WHS68100.1 hypothetical protein QMY55_24635 [Comamonas resistens]GAD21796.1 hypothetical protein AVS7_01556 [Acidovorax sp. MR-S7]